MDAAEGSRSAEWVADFAGRPAFLVARVPAIMAWVVLNTGLLPEVYAFDLFPCSLVGALLFLEGVLLACFLLTKQAHEGRRSEWRSHLNLQTNLLMEHGVTKLI